MWPVIAIGAAIAWFTSACESPKQDINENGTSANKSKADVYETARPKAAWDYKPKFHMGCKW